MPTKTAEEIDAEAAIWVARVGCGPLSAQEEAEFQQWLDGDPRRLGAYGRLRAVAQFADRARALGPGFSPDLLKDMPTPSRRIAFRIGGGIAAATLLGAGLVSWKLLQGRGTHYVTGKGQVKILALEDGSVVTLNTQSELTVHYSDKTRSVQLIRGEALFDVAKNRAQPFVVDAGKTQVRVVGTSFTVRHMETLPVQVLVREGIVEVSQPADKDSRVVRISANTRAVAEQSDIAAAPIAPAELHRELAWRNGQLAFEGKPLGLAAAEFARYSDIKVVVDDPSLSKEEIAGLFEANDPIEFARIVAVSLNAHVRIGDGQVHITR